MNSLAQYSAALLISVLSPLAIAAQSVSELTLAEVLQLALQRDAAAPAMLEQPPQASSWLAGLPSLSVSYLDSNERRGVDETELAVNLPIKSGRRRSADASLQGLSAELEQVSQAQRALYLSGLIREAAWSFRMAEARRRFAGEKRQLLLQLEQQQQALFQASAASEYPLLMLQKELVDVEISQQEYLQQARRWQQQFRHITGLGQLPNTIEEAPLATREFYLHQHPLIRALELDRAQTRQLLQASSDQSADWNLALKAKSLETQGYDEEQYGLAIDVPLSFVNIASQSHTSEWRRANREYARALEQLQLQLQGRWDLLAGESEILQHKQQLLERSAGLTGRIAGHASELLASSEIAQEIALRRMLDAIDTRADAALNQLLIHQNNAMLRQAAGVPL